MQKKIQIKVPVIDATNEQLIRTLLAKESGLSEKKITGYYLLKKSLDARSRYPHVLLTASVFIDEPVEPRKFVHQDVRDVKSASKSVLIVGEGPAGLFAAISLIRSGIKPIIIERGKDIRARRRDLPAETGSTGRKTARPARRLPGAGQDAAQRARGDDEPAARSDAQ